MPAVPAVMGGSRSLSRVDVCGTTRATLTGDAAPEVSACASRAFGGATRRYIDPALPAPPSAVSAQQR